MQPKQESHAESESGTSLTTLTAADLVPGEIEGIVVRDLTRYPDDRGWLAELFRDDEVDAEFRPAMAYVSTTRPGIQRGPHEHRGQADYFCFVGPSTFRLRLWDNRPGSPTFGRVMTLEAGEQDPKYVIIPKGVVHAYRNIGDSDGVVINFPNRLYRGAGRREEVDEIRHEDDPETIFRVED